MIILGACKAQPMSAGEGICGICVRILASAEINILINTSITDSHQNLCRALQFANYISLKLLHLILPVALEPWDYLACTVAG